MVGVHGNEITLPSDGAIDLGGIGKGYLLDKLAKLLDTKGYSNYWLSLGGDIVARGHDADQLVWDIAISAAANDDETVATIRVAPERMMAVATSGITKRKGGKGRLAWHHLIDPRTGQSAQTQVLTATVAATTATEADVYAKCLVLGGLSEAERIIQLPEALRVILQYADGTIHTKDNEGKPE